MKTQRHLLGLVATVYLASAAWAATPGVDEPPLPGSPRPLRVPEWQEARLPNGVRVVVAPRTELPLVTLALHLRLGAAADPEGRAGLAGITASLRTKGASLNGHRLDATQLARQAEALGGALESSADWRGTSVSMTVATSKMDPAAGLLAAVLRQPSLSAAELQRLKTQTADGLKFNLSDPAALAGLVARRSAWGASVFGGSLTPASLERIRREDILALHRRQLRPDLATLVVAGDVTLDQALALAKRHLGDWKPVTDAPPQARAEAASPVTPSTVLVNLPGAGQSGVVVMAPSVAADSPERRVAQVASAVLGGGYSARLNTEIRIKRGLSYGAMAHNELQPAGGWLSANTQTNHPSAAEVVGLIRSEITRLGSTAPTAEEMAARQATLVGGIGRQIETTQGLAGMALDLIGRGRPLADAQQLAPALMAVTAEQVRDFAAKHWAAGPLRTVVVGDLAKAGVSLKNLDPTALVLETTQLDLESPGLRKSRNAQP